MKITFLLAFCFILLIQKTFSQEARIHGPIERRITDSMCNCVANLDLSKITNKAEAKEAYTDCVQKHLDLLKEFAVERNVNMDDRAAMEKVGIDLAVNLLNQDCKGFKQLALTMAGSNKNSDEEISGIAIGKFKRLENKGFNYFIVVDGNGKERSFIWLRQFTNSEKFISGSIKYIGKKIKIKFQEIEVYLPSAKGYYKIKEVTGVEIL